MSSLGEILLRNIGSDLRDLRDIDFKNEEGLWCCGICREPMQKKIEIELPGIAGKEHIVRCQCRCDREKEAEEKRLKKLEEEREAISRLRSASLMDEKVRDSTFATFTVSPENERNLKICKRYAEGFKEMQEKNQGLLFWGNPGTGKTFAAACIANYLLDKREPVMMTSFVKLIAELQRLNGEEDEEDIIRRLNKASLLIIDDLGAERSTDYALERVYNIVDSRYRARKPMLLTTNLSLREMQSTTDIRYARIYDRVFEVCYPVEFKGQSWRYKEAARRYDEMEKLLEG